MAEPIYVDFRRKERLRNSDRLTLLTNRPIKPNAELDERMEHHIKNVDVLCFSGNLEDNLFSPFIIAQTHKEHAFWQSQIKERTESTEPVFLGHIYCPGISLVPIPTIGHGDYSALATYILDPTHPYPRQLAGEIKRDMLNPDSKTKDMSLTRFNSYIRTNHAASVQIFKGVGREWHGRYILPQQTIQQAMILIMEYKL